ncbi:MAG TPA: hypothetical protein VGL86_25805 [Polyangia bacterium]|jgi:hypothetical protein
MRAAIFGMVFLMGGVASAQIPPPPPTGQLIAAQPTPVPGAHDPTPIGRSERIAGIAAWAASTAAILAGFATWREQLNYESDSHQYLTALRPTGQQLTPAEQQFFTMPTCSPPASLGNTTLYRESCNRGQQYSDATTALFVGGAALAVAGTVSYIIGARKASRARERDVAVAPVLGPSLAGLQLRATF